MVFTIVKWLGWVLCAIICGVCWRLYLVHRRLQREQKMVLNEYRTTLDKQHGMTFKFKKVEDKFIHTFCQGELAYRLGIPPECAIGKRLSDFIDDERYVALKKSYYERAWQGEEVSYEGRLNGVWYIASLSPVFVHGKVVEVIATSVDITQQKLAENELRESEQMYRLIAESSTDLIRILGTDTIIRYASPSHEEILGFRPEELVGLSCIQMLVPDDRSNAERAFYEMIATKNEHYQLNFHALRKDGTPILFETHGRLIFNECGDPTGVVVVSRDLTKRMHQAEENQRREKLTLAGQLAAGIAHEIRNPLTAIKGFTQLLRIPSEKQSFYTDIVSLELSRIEEIVNEFLLLAKPEAVEYQTNNLDWIMSDVINLLQPQALMQNVQIDFTQAPSDIPVNSVANQLKQVFINVIKNAVESMSNGGNIHISMDTVDSTVITRIQDEGDGITEESLQRLGEPFYTTKAHGTGLGLMVSYKIVKDHGGTIKVKSSPGKGTCITITLPMASSADTSIAPQKVLSQGMKR